MCWREMDARPEIRWAIGPVTKGFLGDHVQLKSSSRVGSVPEWWCCPIYAATITAKL